jgi:hypothetical protein
MTMKRTPALFLATLLAAVSEGEELPPGMKMHRVGAGELDATGWTLARSTEGRFTVRLPCLFNDFSMDMSAEGGPALASYTLGCLLADGRKLSATSVRYRGGAEAAQGFFAQSAARADEPGSGVERSVHDGLATVDARMGNATHCGFSRLVRNGAANVVLVVEAPKGVCGTLDGAVKVFFDSLEFDAAGGAR